VPESVQSQMESLPKEVREKIDAIMDGFVSGELQPDEIGVPVNFKELLEKLKCGKCGAITIDWHIDEPEGEVYYQCHSCGETAWMTKEEYEEAKRKHPDLVFK